MLHGPHTGESPCVKKASTNSTMENSENKKC